MLHSNVLATTIPPLLLDELLMDKQDSSMASFQHEACAHLVIALNCVIRLTQ